MCVCVCVGGYGWGDDESCEWVLGVWVGESDMGLACVCLGSGIRDRGCVWVGECGGDEGCVCVCV